MLVSQWEANARGVATITVNPNTRSTGEATININPARHTSKANASQLVGGQCQSASGRPMLEGQLQLMSTLIRDLQGQLQLALTLPDTSQRPTLVGEEDIIGTQQEKYNSDNSSQGQKDTRGSLIWSSKSQKTKIYVGETSEFHQGMNCLSALGVRGCPQLCGSDLDDQI